MENLPLIVWLWLTVTVASVLGALVGYWLGQRWGTHLMKRFGQEKHLTKLEHLTTKYGTLGIFIAAFSPIPYKVFGWMAGMGDMAKRPFVIAGLAGRGLRFGLEAVLIGLYGDRALDAMMWFLDNEVLLAVLLIVLATGAWFAYKWWSNLGQHPPVSEA